MKLASFEKILEILPHPNADKLELAKVLGYTCIVVKDSFKVGETCVLIQPDTVLPDKPWAEVFKKKSGRVKAVKLRGQWSFGIVLKTHVFGVPLDSFSIGEDISRVIEVIKYEPPVPQQLDALGLLPTGLGKTDEERCMSGATRIITNTGEIQIEELAIKNTHELAGTKVLSYNINSQECEFQKITGFISSVGKNEWYKITFEDGTTVECTDNHKIFLPELQCFRRADELVVGDIILSL